MLFATLFWSCKSDSLTVGQSLLNEQDRIIVGCDTFPTTTSLVVASDIYTTPDSFLLGECDSRFGTVHADILAQFTCPVGFTYPEGAVVDSACLFFFYNSWFGDGNSPLSLSVYTIDKQALDYNTAYSHNINVDEYVSLTEDNMVIERQRIIVPAKKTDSAYNSTTQTYLPFVRLRLTDALAEQLFTAGDYSSLEEFTQAFKGLYIASDFGSANLLHVTNLNIALYYHFPYNKAGNDTIVTDTKGFYANSEVRQVNRYIYINEDINSLRQDSDSVSYIVSPANLYTRISLPIKSMAEQIIGKMKYASANGDTLSRRPYINKAEVILTVLNHHDGSSKKTRDDWAQPAGCMMLIKESAVERFFSTNEQPTDTCAILSKLTEVTDGGEESEFVYLYDLASLLTNTIRQIQQSKTDTTAQPVPESLNMLLIPVSVTYASSSSSYYSYTTSSTTISSVKHEQTVTATVIQAANNSDDPLDLEVVYSGF